MEKENLEKILNNNPLIDFEGWIEPDKYGFSRRCAFVIRGVRYIIDWHCNCSQLYCGELQVCSFDFITYDGCYPNRFKNSLNFNISGGMFGRPIAVIPVEEYDN